MKMPWYSSYYPESSPRSRFRQPNRASNPASNVPHHHTIHIATSSYAMPSFRQHTHYPACPSPPPSYPRRHYQNEFSHFRPERTGLHSGATSYRPRHSSPNSSVGSSPFKSRSDGSTWYHHRRTADSATERLLARADALTERLHRLLTKSADLHWRRTDNPVRSDIYSQMSQSKAQSTTTGTSPTANMAADTNAAASSVRVDDITVSKTEPRPTTRTHVITIKLSNSYSNRGNRRSQHLVQEPAEDEEQQRPQVPPKPQENQRPRESHKFEESQKLREAKETAERQESPEPQEPSRETHRQKSHESQPSHFNSRTYRHSTTRKPPVVRIIPIHIEVESDDSGIAVDPERDIQVPDEDPRVTINSSPIPSPRHVSSIFVDDPIPVVEIPVMPESTVESNVEPEALDLELEEPIHPASGSTNSRRWALTLR